MEQRAGYAGGDGDQIGLALKYFDLAGAGEFGEVDGASGTDTGDSGSVGGNAGELREELAGMDEEGFDGGDLSCSCSDRDSSTPARIRSRSLRMTGRERFSGSTRRRTGFYLFERVGLRDVELGYGGAAKGFEMSSAAQALAHFVGYGTHVGAAGYAGAEAGAVGFDRKNFEFFDLDLHRFESYFLLFSGKLIGGNALDFLGREWRRDGQLVAAGPTGSPSAS